MIYICLSNCACAPIPPKFKMVVHIQTGKNHVQSTQREARIQRIPCKIHADCDAKVSTYFEPLIKAHNGQLEGTFRGYPLKGNKVIIPDRYKGVIMHESLQPDTEQCDRKFYVIHEFNSIINWNWDKIASKDDALTSAFDWIEIAEALHSPITEE